MQISTRRPKRAVMKVKVDDERNEFEIWLLEPRLISTAKRVGRNVKTPDGMEFPNLDDAARYYLEQVGDPLATARGLEMEATAVLPKKNKTVMFSSLQLIQAGVWEDFARMRGFTNKTVNLEQLHELTRDELGELGLGG